MLPTLVQSLWKKKEVADFRAAVKRALKHQVMTVPRTVIQDAFESIDKVDQNKIKAKLGKYPSTIAAALPVATIAGFYTWVNNEVGQDAMDSLAGQGISITGTFNLTNPDVISHLSDKANLLIDTVDNTTKDQIAQVISDGYTNGQSWQDIANSISQGNLTDLNGNDLIGYRSELIARMETANAAADAQQNFYEKSGLDQGQKTWELGPDHDKDDDCDDNADGSPIDYSDDFDSGDFWTPAHINCGCSVSVAPPDGYIADNVWDGSDDEGDEEDEGD